MRVIIAGGRDYRFTPEDIAWLDSILAEIGPFTEVISGGAAGADAEGEKWAASNGIPVKRFLADWDRYGRSAGPRRNEAMACYAGRGQLCILFDGGRGTASMEREAIKVGMSVAKRSESF